VLRAGGAPSRVPTWKRPRAGAANGKPAKAGSFTQPSRRLVGPVDALHASFARAAEERSAPSAEMSIACVQSSGVSSFGSQWSGARESGIQ